MYECMYILYVYGWMDYLLLFNNHYTTIIIYMNEGNNN